MRLVFASTNPHKLREMREILGPLGLELDGLEGLGAAVPEPAEVEATLEGNARLKATAYARALRRPCLADDSGLEVDALGGAPGVHSARYAGSGSTREERDRKNRAKLVAELQERGDVSRRARLVCVLCLADETGRVLFHTRGAVEAVVTDEPRGEHGFGYDSLLFLPDVNRTLAELSPAELNARSHRGAAARALHAWLLEHPLEKGA
ncbi:MAG TPA: RdgB/HAM1 family non-canonical purine NTP pyrophosphatase [Polyangiaceae bacterium]|nr:RdgB/HAM1 family non-canonical purine NTP pyrophosphatase [Polyangiaceae bacterium]